MPVIAPGDHSEEVADVQARLRGVGLHIDDDAGHFGPSTAAAVRAFQQRRGLLTDGLVGVNTWTELVEASRRLGDRILYLKRPMMRGDDVLVLQERLNALGFDAGRADGLFGPETAAAVRGFQKEYGVAEDGMFGPITHAALVGLRVNRPGTAATLRDELRRTEPGRSNLNGALIVVDPAHGGAERGRRGPGGSWEADLCWRLALRVAERLAGAGARVRLSRTEAECPDVGERARRANELGADLFISLALNAYDGSSARGASSYFFKGSHSAEMLAECVQGELVALGMTDCRSHGRSYRLLKETRMPAVLIEPAFVTNPEDAGRLVDPEGLRGLADAIVRGVRRYFGALA